MIHPNPVVARADPRFARAVRYLESIRDQCHLDGQDDSGIWIDDEQRLTARYVDGIVNDMIQALREMQKRAA